MMAASFRQTKAERRRAVFTRLGVVCFLLTVLAWNGLVLAANSPSTETSTVKTGLVQTAVAVTTNAGATLPVISPVAANKTELDVMKDAFADLMKNRAELSEQYRQSRKCITESRRTDLGNPLVKSETGARYRDAMMRVERALDEHPQIRALQSEYDSAQTQKVAVSVQKGEVQEAWRAALEADRDALFARAESAKDKAAAEKDAFYKSLDSNTRDLTTAESNQVMAIQDRLVKELAHVLQDGGKSNQAERAKEAREKDGSAKRFADLADRYNALEERQRGLKAEMNRLRFSLRKSDPAIAALQEAANTASRAHLGAVDATPAVADARRFIDDFTKRQAEIDKRARVVRRAILKSDPACKPTLDKQATAAGLALVTEDFWKVEE